MLVAELRRVFEAAVAALVEVTLPGAFLCESADPAADFDALLALGFLSTLEAAEAAFLLVTSVLFAIFNSLNFISKFFSNLCWRYIENY